ncbi:MAG: transposase [Leadbetterella sp.]
MTLLSNTLYHIYNQGNNKEIIFKNSEDYLLFLSKIKTLIKPKAEILSYCLMPNHFHFLVLTTEKSIETIKIGSLNLSLLSNGIRLLLSEYAQEFNKKYKRTGSLFRQKTKIKIVDNGDSKYPKQVFYYILRNPLEAKLVSHLSEWQFSSYLDHIQARKGKISNLELCKDIFQFSINDLKEIGAGYDDLTRSDLRY